MHFLETPAYYVFPTSHKTENYKTRRQRKPEKQRKQEIY